VVDGVVLPEVLPEVLPDVEPDVDGVDGLVVAELELLDGADWLLLAPPEAEPAFFSSVVVEPETDEELDGLLLLGGVAEEELDEDGEDGVVAALPLPPEAEPDAEPEPDGVLGVVADDEEEPAEPAGRSPRLSPHAARPRAIATEIANAESLMSPPWLGYRKPRALCVPGFLLPVPSGLRRALLLRRAGGRGGRSRARAGARGAGSAAAGT